MKRKKIILLTLILLSFLMGCSQKKQRQVTKSKNDQVKKVMVEKIEKDEIEDYLHVESPDWRDQIIYFIMTDRFNDGDPSNNDQGANEYDPTKNSHYSGGDIPGITEKIGYIKKLGATAIWITPPVANQWWDPWVHYSGYHGYWGENFKKVDKHYGTLEDYQELSATLHKNEMYLIQDIVPNHTGNFMRYKGEYDPEDVTKNVQMNKGSLPVTKPTQKPFDMNDPRKKEDREAQIYNFTPKITDFKDKSQLKTYQMSGLDDLNTKNPVVRNELKDSYNYWIENVGVDGFRIDTVVYVEHDFWNDFVHSEDEDHLGVENFAKKFKKDDFYTFGETWVNVDPYDEKGDIRASSYEGTEEKPEMTSVLNFPMHVTMQRVFGESKPTSFLTYRIKNSKKYYKDNYKLLNFVDNHDMNRLLTSAPYSAVKQSMMYMMTIPGVPVIYYGTEQQFTTTRASMFEEGFASEGEDHFDTSNDMFKFLKDIIEIRKEYPVFRRGEIKVLDDNAVGAGVFAYKMEYEGEKAFIIFNTSNNPMLLDKLDTGLEEGTHLKLLKGLLRIDKDLTVGKDGKLSKILQPRAGLVYIATDKKDKVEKTDGMVTMRGLRNGEELKNNIKLTGEVTGTDEVYLVIDGDIRNMVDMNVDENGNWTGNLPVETLSNDKHTVVAYADMGSRKYTLSKSYNFIVNMPFIKGAEYKDEIGDDNGPTGDYLYPTAETFDHQMDIEKATVYKSGKNIKVDLKMADEISTIWNPKYKFDHVSINFYIDLPNKEGAKILPYQNAEVPKGMDWDYMTLFGGWTNFIYGSRGSGPENWGRATGQSAKISTDPDNRTISFTISGSALGNPDTLEGINIYITTWDYDGLESRYRELQPEPKAYIFGGGEKSDPKIIDDTGILEIK